MSDPFDLERFVSAQDTVWPDVTAELSAGAKRTHWMWFVFPQIAGLGHSPTAVHYALPSLNAAKAYLKHPVLGGRLEEATGLVLGHAHKSAGEIFGSIDAVKFRSSMTLFDAAGGGPLFADALEAFYGGVRDSATLEILSASETASP
ncbi:DUF1810 domain-containing protein [Thalassospiraceae bacterium LMO-JJ14]|nr:DUF1810 domain-containing protein [Thalassospiraceae bacterium LMO-JJ14]